MKRENLLEKLIDSEVKAELLTLFHNNPQATGTLEELANKISRKPEEIKADVAEFAELGLLNITEVYSFNQEKDLEIQRAIASQLNERATIADSAVVETPERGKTGIALIDDLLIDELPSALTIGILGPSGTGKSVLCQQFVREALRKEQTVVYITLDYFPQSIRDEIIRLGCELEGFERKGKFLILDCYSPQIGSVSSEKYSEDPRNLSNLSIAISQVLQEGKPGAIMVILDSLTTLIQKCGVTESLRHLHTCLAKLRSYRASCLIKFNHTAFHNAVAAAVKDIVDGAIETKTEETPAGINNYIRISKMHGTRHLTTWTPYSIDPKLGLLKGKV